MDAGPGNWRVTLYFGCAVDAASVRELAGTVAGAAAAGALRFASIAAADWVAESLAGLKPVAAGRFTVHGAHHRAGIPRNRIGIEIEAALAFGTGHHGTTRGCLLTFDRMCKLLRGGKAAPRILDLGTGSGVLAIAAARALHRRILATDIDAAAVRVARANVRLNRVGPLVEVARAAGVTAPAIRARAPFDLRLRQYPARAAAAPRRAADRDRRAGRLRRAVRPFDRAGQCRARRLSRVSAGAADRSSTVGSRWCSCAADKPLSSRKDAARLPCMFEAHFQSFEDRSASGDSAPRLAALRAELKRHGLDGFIVPRADRYQNEYVPPCAERLAWLTGFAGSAGIAIVLADRAVLFVDGRYTVQARDEVDAAAFAIEHLVEHPPPEWIQVTAGRRQARLFAVAAHRRRCRTLDQSLRGGRRQPGCRRR